MAYVAKDGKAFGNREAGAHYDKTRPTKEPSEPKEPSEGGGKEEDMRQVVDEHGPAESMVMHSTHADGHVHKSKKHHDPESAHKHVAEAFGQEPEQESAPASIGSEMSSMMPGM